MTSGIIDPPARIVLVRGLLVILDAELARLYGVETREVLQAVRRNPERFPDDFVIVLKKEELRNLRSQSVISSWGGRRTLPHAFTEHGVAMLASVLRSERAVRVNIEIIRMFVRLRRQAAEIADLATRLDELEQRYDARFRQVFDALRQMIRRDAGPHRKIGF